MQNFTGFIHLWQYSNTPELRIHQQDLQEDVTFEVFNFCAYIVCG